MNIHTPERQAHETQAEYRARRAQSRDLVRTMTKGPRQAPAINALDTSRFFLGQHTNPEKPISLRDMHRGPQRAAQVRRRWIETDAVKARAATRERKQHHHELRDALGAFTLVGRGTDRRKWLAGISAQRGI